MAEPLLDNRNRTERVIRPLRSGLAANLPISAIAFAVYLCYGALSGLDFDHEFLGIERGRYGKATWPVMVMVETYVAVAFTIQRCCGEPHTRHAQWFYVVCGITGLSLMAATGGGLADASLCAFGLYVWLSVIAYGALVKNP